MSIPATPSANPSVGIHGINKGPQIEKNISTDVTSILSKIKRAGIFVTGVLPFSRRGIIAQFVSNYLGLGFLFAGVKAFAQCVRGKPVTAFNNIKANWSAGIHDSYIVLSKLKGADREAALADIKKGEYYNKEHQYRAFIDPQRNLVPQQIDDYPAGYKEIGKEVEGELYKIGFKKDQNGAYYNLNTGTMLNLSYDTKTSEFIVSFWGIGNEGNLKPPLNTLNLPQNILNLPPDKLDYAQGLTRYSPKILENFWRNNKPDPDIVKAVNAMRDPMSKIFSQINKANIKAIAGDVLGGMNASHLQAIQIGELVKKAVNKSGADAGIKPMIIGHSHGGGLAQAAALSNGLPAITFNSRPLGANMRRFIGQDRIQEGSKKVLTFSVKGDFLTSTRIVNFLAILFERITGYPVPRNVGKGYILEKSPQGTNPHVDVSEAFNETLK